ncbi:MAG: sigma-70 family RNA polymerase sigma factor [Candidatus Aminicenantes bacterium]|jgi:RNA polymerase sigma-70 factor (ECF subfamily)
MEEKELVQLSREGREEAFAELVKKYRIKVFNLAFSLTRDRDVADDLAQEAFIKAYYALPRFQSRSGFGTWLYRIVINHVRDYLRKKSRMIQISIENIKESSILQEDKTMKEEKESTEEQRKQLVHRSIRSLPEKHQVILSLRDIQGFSYEEISKILKISPGTVDSRIHRARKMLRKKLAPFFSRKGGEHEL